MSFKEYSLEECCDILDNLRVPMNSEERFDIKGEYPYYGANGVQGYISKYVFDDNLILIAEDGGNFEQFATRPIAYKVSGKCWVNNHAHVLKAKKDFSQNFIFYSLEHKNILYFIAGGTRSKLTQGELRRIPILHPEKVEAERIGEILNTIEKAISQTETIIAKYQRIKTGMMQDLLTKGIDANGNIRSKSTHKFIVKKGIEVPEDWSVEYLGDVCSKIQDGTHFSPKTSDDGEFMYLTSKNIRLGYLDLSNVEFINRKQHEGIYKRCAVKFGDVLLTKDGANTGNATVNNIREQFSLLSSVCLIRGKEDVLNNNFLLSLLLCERGQRLIKDSMSGLAITRVTLQIINKFIFPIPSLPEQIEISNRIQQMENSILIFRKDLEKFQLIKTGLMQDLLSGKVRVKA